MFDRTRLANASGQRRLLVVVLYLVLFVAFDYVSYVKPFGTFGATPWNPQAGLSVSLIYLGGTVYALPVLLSASISDYVLRAAPLGFSLELLTSLATGFSHILCALLLQRFLPFDPRFRTVRDVITFVGAAFFTSALAAGLYTIVLAMAGELGRGDFLHVAWRLFIGGLIGILVVCPVILLVVTLRPAPMVRRTWMLQFAAIVAALLIIFGYRDATAFQLFYLLFLPLLWVALTYGTAGSAAALVVIQIGLVIGAEIRFGNAPGLAALQTLMIALTVTGLVVGAVVTEREAAAARSRDQQSAMNRTLRVRAAGEIAAAIAHEVNQPLTAIKTYASVASKALEDGNVDLVRLAIGKLSTQSDRAAQVIKSIRELLHQGQYTPAPIDLSELLSEFVNLYSGNLQLAGVALTYSVPETLPIVWADKIQLSQALLNLVNNSADAIRGTSETGHISVDVDVLNPNSYVISVRDDGPGFPPSFNTEDPTLFVTTKVEGSGIGLSIARTVAEIHGGRLVIETSRRGAHVKLILPLERGRDAANHFDSR